MFLRPAIHHLFSHDGRSAARAILVTSGMCVLAGCAATPANESGKVAPDPKAASAFAVPDWVKSGGEGKRIARAITPDDLIGADGSCSATRIAAVEQQPASESDAGSSNPAGMATMQQGPTISGGIALAMSECDVAQRAGYPGNVEIGSEAGGERSAVLTYRQGPWPGIYRFRGGRLVSIERVEVIEPPKVKKVAKPSKPPTKVNLRSSAPQ